MPRQRALGSTTVQISSSLFMALTSQHGVPCRFHRIMPKICRGRLSIQQRSVLSMGCKQLPRPRPQDESLDILD